MIRLGNLLENYGDDTWKSFLNDDSAFKLYTATNTEKRKTVQARKTNKTWSYRIKLSLKSWRRNYRS